MEALSIVYAIN